MAKVHSYLKFIWTQKSSLKGFGGLVSSGSSSVSPWSSLSSRLVRGIIGFYIVGDSSAWSPALLALVTPPLVCKEGLAVALLVTSPLGCGERSASGLFTADNSWAVGKIGLSFCNR